MKLPIKFDEINGVRTVSEKALECIVNRLCTIHEGHESVYIPQFDITVKAAPYSIVNGCRMCVFNSLCSELPMS